MLDRKRETTAVLLLLFASIFCCSSMQAELLHNYQLFLMHCITANVLQTKVDAQCDKLGTELSWQCLRRSIFTSYRELSYLLKFAICNLLAWWTKYIIWTSFCSSLLKVLLYSVFFLCFLVCTVYNRAALCMLNDEWMNINTLLKCQNMQNAICSFTTSTT